MGTMVDAQVRAMLDKGPKDRPFECGAAPVERAGRAALEKLMARLSGAAGGSMTLKPAVVRRPEANAVALPAATSMSSRA